MKVKAAFFDQMSEQWDTICRHDEMKLRYLLSRVSIQSGDSVLGNMPFFYNREIFLSN